MVKSLELKPLFDAPKNLTGRAKGCRAKFVPWMWEHIWYLVLGFVIGALAAGLFAQTAISADERRALSSQLMESHQHIRRLSKTYGASIEDTLFKGYKVLTDAEAEAIIWAARLGEAVLEATSRR